MSSKPSDVKVGAAVPVAAPQKLTTTKMVFGMYFDSMRFIPDTMRSHQFKLSITRNDRTTHSDPFGIPDSGAGTDSCTIRFLYHVEATLTPTSTKLSYKPTTVRVQVHSTITKAVIVDAQINLAQFAKGDRVPMTRCLLNGLEPPLTLYVAIQGNSAAAAKEMREKLGFSSSTSSGAWVKDVPPPDSMPQQAASPTKGEATSKGNAPPQPSSAIEDDSAASAGGEDASKPKNAWFKSGEYQNGTDSNGASTNNQR
jgi:hypothetical protein